MRRNRRIRCRTLRAKSRSTRKLLVESPVSRIDSDTPLIDRQRIIALRRQESVRRWLRGKSSSTQNRYLRALGRVCVKIEEGPNGLIRLAENAAKATLRELVDEYPPATRSILVTFFRANRVEV
jgi:hypothetical protein